MTAPLYDIRLLTTQTEFEACAALQREIWGLPEAEAMSSITMHALAMGIQGWVSCWGLLTGMTWLDLLFLWPHLISRPLTAICWVSGRNAGIPAWEVT